jgi:hypothetical protein
MAAIDAYEDIGQQNMSLQDQIAGARDFPPIAECFLTISGVSYRVALYPSPVWAPAIDSLQQAVPGLKILHPEGGQQFIYLLFLTPARIRASPSAQCPPGHG